MKTKRWIAILFLMVAATTFGKTKTGLPFIQDDYSKALTKARQNQLPIFVECWAPW